MQAMSNMLTVGGSMIQGYGALQAGNYNRDAMDAAARDAEATGVAQEQRVRDRGRQAIGEQIGAQFGNGFQGGTGTALDTLKQSQINAAMDVLEVRRQAAATATSYRNRGAMAAAEGRGAFALALLGGAAKSWSMGEDWATARRPYQTAGSGGAY